MRVIAVPQEKYTLKVLDRFNIADRKSASTPMVSQIEQKRLQPDSLDSTVYRQIIKSLILLIICTLPDIKFAVETLSQFTEHSTVAWWTCVKRVFQYFSGTKTFGITYISSKTSSLGLKRYSEADWAGCYLSKKSTSGYVF